jgi:hypothetical protein
MTTFEVLSLNHTTLNFFQRRKILKKANYLDLTPLRKMQFEPLEDGKVDILMPRFSHTLWKRALQPHWKQEIIRIHLDEVGSAIWLEINGSIPVSEICYKVQTAHPEKLQPPDETEKRVTQFLSLLYQQRYITFNEINLEKKQGQSK